MIEEKKILDVTCGSKTIWFNKNHPSVVYCDKRNERLMSIWKSTSRDSERKLSLIHILFSVEVVDEKTGEVKEALQEACGVAPGQINLSGDVVMPEIYIPSERAN